MIHVSSQQMLNHRLAGLPANLKPEEPVTPQEQGWASVPCPSCCKAAAVETVWVIRRSGTYLQTLVRCPSSYAKRLAWKKYAPRCPVIILEEMLVPELPGLIPRWKSR